MNTEKKFLPIGSVVTLKEATKKIMITGYLSKEDDDKVFDYSGCVYPEGILTSNQICLFDSSDIQDINFEGFKNEEFNELNNSLMKINK